MPIQARTPSESPCASSRSSTSAISQYSADKRATLLSACRPDERPMVQFWFETGLRPGELQALGWDGVDLRAKVVRITQNQVAGVIKGPKTAAGRREIDLSQAAIDAIQAQRAISSGASRVWLNPSTLEPWQTDAQVPKTL